MRWIIKDGMITDVDGDGIRIEDPSGGFLISGMTIRNAKGSGIVIGGGQASSASSPLALENLLREIEGRIPELPENKQEQVRGAIERIRKDPNTSSTRRGLQVIYDVSVNVAGSTIATLLASLLS
jgi:hypothetical protein